MLKYLPSPTNSLCCGRHSTCSLHSVAEYYHSNWNYLWADLYANVLAANKAIFLPFTDPNFLTVFVSWVNLDLGIETCFYDGMNSQAKVLLQLAFPAYLFLLMFLIIILSKYVNSFAKLLSNRNPVAALCTLLILSYSKLLRLIIAALQFTSLLCPDNSMRLFGCTMPMFSTFLQVTSLDLLLLL